MKPRTASSSVGIVRYPGAAQDIADLRIGPDPDGQHRLGATAVALAIIPDQFGDGRCDVRSRGDRGLHIHHQDRVVAGIVEQRLQRHGIARSIGIADDIDGI